jgi:hypothetical protein
LPLVIFWWRLSVKPFPQDVCFFFWNLENWKLWVRVVRKSALF